MNGKLERMKEREAAAEQAKVEKAERKETAAELSDEIRLEQLRQLGKNRSQEEQREYMKLYKRARRRDERGEQSPLAKVEDAESFWAANRATLTKKNLDELLAQQELVLDQEWWMEHGFECDPSDEDYVGLDEGMRDLDAFIKQRGLIHDEQISCTHWWLQDFRGILFETKGYDAFFKRLDLFNLLCQESPATETYARYGIRTALFAFHVRTFKQRIAEHHRAKKQLDVRRAHLEFSDRCWLCRAWAAHQAREAQAQSPQAVVEQPPTIA